MIRHERWTFVILCVLSLALRVMTSLCLPDTLLTQWDNDPDAYRAIARDWVTTGVYGIAGHASAYRPPLLPALLTPLTPLPLGVQAVAILAGQSLLIACLAFLAGRITANLLDPDQPGTAWLSWLARGLVLADPLLLRQSIVAMTEPCHSLLLFLAMKRLMDPFVTGQRSAWLMGGLLGLSTLCRPTTLPVVASWIVMELVVDNRRDRWRFWATATLSIVLMLTPWCLRNYWALGTPVWTTTHGGYTLWLGYNPVFYREAVLAGKSTWTGTSFDQWQAANAAATVGMNEIERDRYFQRQALTWMAAEPGFAVHVGLRHVQAFWSVAPESAPLMASRLVLVWYTLLYIGAGVGLAALFGRPSSVTAKRDLMGRWVRLTLSLAIALSSLHTLYWSNPRMRTPLCAPLVVLAVVGAARMVAGPPRPTK